MLHKALILIIALVLPSCQTSSQKVVTQSINVHSEPPGATVVVDGSEAGHTPLQLKLNRNAKHVIHLNKKGYASETVPIYQHYLNDSVKQRAFQEGLNTVKFFGDTQLGQQKAELSISDDEKSGRAYELVPKNIRIHLSKVPENDS